MRPMFLRRGTPAGKRPPPAQPRGTVGDAQCAPEVLQDDGLTAAGGAWHDQHNSGVGEARPPVVPAAWSRWEYNWMPPRCAEPTHSSTPIIAEDNGLQQGIAEGGGRRGAPQRLKEYASGGEGRDALEGKGPQRQPQRRIGRRLEEVAKAVGGGYCWLQMPLRLALGVRGTVAGHRLGALEGGGGGGWHKASGGGGVTSSLSNASLRRGLIGGPQGMY